MDSSTYDRLRKKMGGDSSAQLPPDSEPWHSAPQQSMAQLARPARVSPISTPSPSPLIAARAAFRNEPGESPLLVGWGTFRVRLPYFRRAASLLIF